MKWIGSTESKPIQIQKLRSESSPIQVEQAGSEPIQSSPEMLRICELESPLEPVKRRVRRGTSEEEVFISARANVRDLPFTVLRSKLIILQSHIKFGYNRPMALLR